MELMPGHKHSDVGSIPEDWDVLPLGKLVRSVEYGSAAKSDVKGAVPVLRMGNLQGGKIDWRDLVYTDDLDEINKYMLQPGDVLFNRTNTIDLVGKTSIYEGGCPAIFAGYLIRINVVPELLDSRFLNYILNTEFSRKYSAKVLSVAVGQANINGQKLKTYPIPLPPTKIEQEDIAQALSDVDALLATLDQMIAKKHDLKQAAMQQLLTGKTRLPGFTGEWSRLDLVRLVSTPITDGPHLTPKFYADGVPFLSVNNLVDNRIDLTDLRFISKEDDEIFAKKCKPRIGDVLLGKAASVGKVAIVETEFDFNIWSPIALIRPGGQINGKFLYYQLLGADSVAQIMLLTNSSSQGNIGMGDIEKIQISFPGSEEQTAIAAVLSEMDSELSALEARRDKINNLKQAMMQDLLTGKKRLV